MIKLLLLLTFSSPLLAKPLSVLDYYHQINPKGSNKPVAGAQFEKQDLVNGYLKVTGAMEGYYLYVLFKGSTSDVVIEQGTSCGPECEQRFSVYRFVNGKLKGNEKFDKYYPKAKVDKHFEKLAKKDYTKWLYLPVEGRNIKLLLTSQNPGHTNGSVEILEAGDLKWQGSAFIFQPEKQLKKSKLTISEID